MNRPTIAPLTAKLFVLTAALTSVLTAALAAPAAAQIAHLQGEMAGEVTADSVILQSRLTAPSVAADGDVPGAAGVARFDVASRPDFAGAKATAWLNADPEHDYIVKVKVTGLKPATRYFYRLVFGPDKDQARRGPVRSFATLAAPDAAAPVSFIAVTGMNYARFHGSARGKAQQATKDDAGRLLGYPALASMLKLDPKPDFFVGTGDNVYYDHPGGKAAANTTAAMRKKWHEQFVQRRYVDLFAQVPTFWEKDDHDHRFNDNDNSGNRPPTSDLGIAIFKEQMPVTDPADAGALTYRTHRVSKDLQIWLTEGRDYRSPNNQPDGPDKTLWGQAQLDWLKKTLTQSDAAFKILISPTALVGPDDAYKRDNHVNERGFRHEGTAFLEWAKDNGFLDKGLYIICGDRHWQYHSVHPTGFQEFSTGALVDANARLGRKPGDPKSTDPDAKVKQLYTSKVPSGGFLNVVIQPSRPQRPASARFDFYDENGVLLYSVTKTGK